MPAAQLHAFHTTLMVAALRCRSERPEALSSYNAFVEARKSSIEAARTVVQARFIKEMGPESGLTEFKNFDTEIANRASIAGPAGMPCDGVDTYSRLAASASEADLFTLARLNNPGVEIRSCGMEPTVAVAGSTLKATPPSQAPQEEAPMPGAAKMVAMPASPPEPATGSETPKQAAVAETSAAADANAKVDPAKALDDAARALALAASSLRTASAADQ